MYAVCFSNFWRFSVMQKIKKNKHATVQKSVTEQYTIGVAFLLIFKKNGH